MMHIDSTCLTYGLTVSVSNNQVKFSTFATCIFFLLLQLEDNTSHKHYCRFQKNGKEKTTFISICLSIGQHCYLHVLMS